MSDTPKLVAVRAYNLSKFQSQLHNLYQELSSRDSVEGGMEEMRRRLKKALESDNKFHLVLVALVEGSKPDVKKTVGTGSVICVRTGSHWEFWIHDVVVSQEYKRNGVGLLILNKLLEHVEDKVRKEILHEVAVKLTSNPARKEANRLYVRLGFELVSEAVRDDDGNYVSGATNMYRRIISPPRGENENAK